VLGVDGVIEAADVGGGKFPGEMARASAELGKLRGGVDWRTMGQRRRAEI